MFKKDPQSKASSNIKTSERRKLFGSICEQFNLPKDQISKEIEYKIVPATVKQATFKNIYKVQGTIYYNENETPVWFKTRDSPLYPSVFTVWQCPYILPKVITNPHVIDVIYNGADLMLPGCGLPFDTRIDAGTAVGIVDYKSPAIIKAIGVAKMPLKDIRKTTGTNGVAVEVLHHAQDELFKLNKYVDIKIPKELDGTAPWPEEEQEHLELEESEESESEEEESEVSPKESVNVENGPHEQDTENNTKEVDDLADQVEQLRVEDIDNFFVRSLLQSIKLDTMELPSNSSNFMAHHVYKNLPDIDIQYKNIKKTSWKKTGKYLKAMSKLNYITVKGKDDDLTIVKTIPKTEKIIEDFVPHKFGKPKKTGQNDKEGKNEIKLIQLYQPTGKYTSFFNELNKPFARPYTLPELKVLVEEYIKRKGLIETDPKKVTINDTLKKFISQPVVPRNELMTQFAKNLSPKFQVVQPGEDPSEAKIYNGQIPNIEIITETKIGRKTITRVKHFEKFGIKPHIIEEDLRNLCQGSSTLEETKDDVEVIVQGPHYKAILNYLIKLGIPSRVIKFEDKSKKKKKRN